jgi:hypothetical protein
MIELLGLIVGVVASLVRSRAELQAENLVLRQQINVLRRGLPKRPALNNTDRLMFVWLYHWFPASWRRSRSSGQRRSFARTVPGLGRTGAGGHAFLWEDRRHAS